MSSPRNSCWAFLMMILGLLRFAISINVKPNILVFLTDDLDVELGGLEPLQKTRRWIGDQGIHFINSFVSTPICCPSRSSTLTGLYQHNTKVFNNSMGGNCNSETWQNGPETRTYATELKKAGYVTMYSGKYLNTYGSKASGGVEHVPLGWDFWSGLVGNSKYYNYTLSINGKAEHHGDSYEKDYLTDVIGKKAQSFLSHYQSINSTSPFLMVLAPPAPHAPFTPAPQYANHFLNHTAPRTPAFNHKSTGSAQKHWLIQTQPQMMSPEVIARVDEAFRNRWRTLLSVDDLVDGVLKTLDQFDRLKDTMVVFTSDHGYHLGQFGLPLDKRQLYDTDLRVPLLVRGPGILTNSTKRNVVTNIDLAPTLVELGTGHVPDDMDGTSFVHLMMTENNFITPPQPQHSFLVEYHGENGAHGVDQQCEAITDQHMVECEVQFGCKCQDARNNTFSCVRTFSQSEDTVYCHFQDDAGFIEMYNLKQDPFQLENIASELTPEVKSIYEEKIQILKKCHGREECFQA